MKRKTKMEFNYIVEEKSGFRVISLNGNLLDREMASEMLTTVDELIAKGQNHLIIDLKELDHINSNGLNVLITILTKARNAGGDSIITNIPEKVNKLFIITKLNTVFTVTDSRKAAFEEFSNLSH
ncbi:MAG: hypothetical protein COA57_10095 [Flavobacteriales bacterium]|nr:MAG: hypothetical protein COA57_10095 [Flavobacteriales bacterium]